MRVESVLRVLRADLSDHDAQGESEHEREQGESCPVGLQCGVDLTSRLSGPQLLAEEVKAMS